MDKETIKRFYKYADELNIFDEEEYLLNRLAQNTAQGLAGLIELTRVEKKNSSWSEVIIAIRPSKSILGIGTRLFSEIGSYAAPNWFKPSGTSQKKNRRTNNRRRTKFRANALKK